MDLGLTGRIAVVTGGARGIGAETVRLLGRRARRVLRGVALGDGIDVTALDAAERILERARRPGLDILVNNAGTSYAKPLDELTEEDWQLQWELNVMASMRLMRAFAAADGRARLGPDRQRRLLGRQAPVAHQRRLLGDARRRSPRSRACSPTPTATAGVLVNAVAPGPVASELWMAEGGLADQTAQARGLSREEAIEVQAGKMPLGRFGTTGGDRERRRLPLLRARGSTSPAPTGRSTAARLQPSSEAETIAADATRSPRQRHAHLPDGHGRRPARRRADPAARRARPC